MSEQAPEVWGGGCECWVTPEHMWTTHYGAVEPGSQLEFNPDCPEHGDSTTSPERLREAKTTTEEDA